MPTRRDLQRVVEWCDRDLPVGWLKSVAGVALAARAVIPVGTPSPAATALWTGDLALREPPGISELADQPVRFAGTLVGVRNPARHAQLSIRADGDRMIAKLSGDGVPAAWGAGLEIEHVRDDSGLISADWTLADLGAASEPRELAQVFELLIWPALRANVDLGPP